MDTLLNHFVIKPKDAIRKAQRGGNLNLWLKKQSTFFYFFILFVIKIIGKRNSGNLILRKTYNYMKKKACHLPFVLLIHFFGQVTGLDQLSLQELNGAILIGQLFSQINTLLIPVQDLHFRHEITVMVDVPEIVRDPIDELFLRIDSRLEFDVLDLQCDDWLTSLLVMIMVMLVEMEVTLVLLLLMTHIYDMKSTLLLPLPLLY